MAQLPINIGTVGNDGTGTNWRTAWGRVQDNFTDLYALQSQTISAGDVRFADELTTEARIQAANDQAVAELAAYVFIPADMLPYDIGLVTPSAGIRFVWEGGDWTVYDVRAYGADPTGVLDAGPAWNACRASIPVAGGQMRVSNGTYKLTTAFTFGAQSNISLQIDAGVTLTGEALPAVGVDDTNLILDARAGMNVSRRVTTPVLHLTPGNAPSTPQDGDVWVTSAGLFVRVNGGTVGPLT
jgi:hypothetical protein